MHARAAASPPASKLGTSSSPSPTWPPVQQQPLRTSSGSLSSAVSHASSMHDLRAQDEELFEELQDQGPVTIRRLQQALSAAGLHAADPRLKQTLSLQSFRYVIESASLLIYRALTHKLVIPDWHAFIREIDHLYRECAGHEEGQVASYIPELANADPSTWAMAFCSIDGQQHGAGDTTLPFSVQSCSKPLSYLMALEELGRDEVHRFVGREPSGRNFNELCLNQHNIPHNPMINAGAIMVASLIQHGAPAADRFAHVLHYWKQLTGYSRDITFSNTVYLSERASANRNFCLGYLMQERKAFHYGTDQSKPHRAWTDTDLHTNLDLYFQCCSIQATTQAMSVVAATLAHGGVCPLTGERVFQSEHVTDCLSLMLSCGMYDYSGEWGFVVGLPAKSGVSGCVMVVIPNVGGFALQSPKLDELGNSARGIEFSKRIAKRFGLHFLNFTGQAHAQGVPPTHAAAAAAVAPSPSPSPSPPPPMQRAESLTKGGTSGKLGAKPLRESSMGGGGAGADTAGVVPSVACLIRKPQRHYHDMGIALIFACAQGDMGQVRALLASAVDLNTSDYDGRTPLHLAASNGHLAIVELLLRKGVELNPVDRIGGTPLADAVREGHVDVINFLRAAGATVHVEVDQGDEHDDFDTTDVHHDDQHAHDMGAHTFGGMAVVSEEEGEQQRQVLAALLFDDDATSDTGVPTNSIEEEGEEQDVEADQHYQRALGQPHRQRVSGLHVH